MRFVCTLALCFLAATAASAQYAHTRGNEIIGHDGQPLHIRGTNLGNWMVPEGYFWRLNGPVQSPREIDHFFTRLLGPTRDTAFWQMWRDRWITAEDIRFIRQAGFNTIRVPLQARLLATDDSEGFRLLDRLIGWADNEGLYIVLDMHAAPGGGTGSNIDDSDGYPWVYEDAAPRAEYIALWGRIARRYRNETAILGYDLLNEPLPHYPATDHLQPMLEPLYKDATARIRKEDSHHAIILEGSQWDTDFSNFSAPFDTNTIYEIHHYGNFDDKHFDKYLDFQAKFHVPLYLGEAGENTDDWVARMRTLADVHGIGWTFWPYKKLQNHSAIVTCGLPPDWDKIVAFSKINLAVGNHKENYPARPDRATIDAVFAWFPEHINLQHCQVNTGYLRAMLPDSPALTSAPGGVK